ncbi:MAG: glycosyltransferase family 4 protein, partial [Desulfuromonadaceae bacterium]|nr:glycosyltransferase family 4 protein [Desulfuromonadaceae bacterium]
TANGFVNANPKLSGRISVIHYGIHLPSPPVESKSIPERKRRFFKNSTYPLIGMVGELWKNQAELIPITRILAKDFPTLTVAIVGGEEESSFSELKKHIVASGLEKHFALIPRVPRRVIPDIFYDFDLSVSTHRNEGFGIVHIESLAAGTPVVAYNAGGLVEILEKGGSILVDGGAENMAQAITVLLTNTDKKQHLAAEGRLIVESEFSIDIMSKRHLDYYHKVVDGSEI